MSLPRALERAGMASVIDVACDICGQLYQWSDERLGDSATCRTCGAKFEVEQYIPPEEEEAQALNNNPLPWIKGACVATLIMFVLAGLSSLLFYRPASRTVQTAGAPWSGVQPIQPANFGNSDPISDTPSRLRDTVARNRLRNAQRAPANTGSPGSGIQTPLTSAIAPTGPAPEVTGWSIRMQDFRSHLKLEGSGLGTTTRLQQAIGGQSLHDISFRITSDRELQVGPVLASGRGKDLYLITCPNGLAVLYPDTWRMIEGPLSVALPEAPCNALVRSGGHLNSSVFSNLLLESGARADCSRMVFLAFVKRGAELDAQMGMDVFSEPGAIVKYSLPPPKKVIEVPAINFCLLPKLDSDNQP